MAGPKGRVRNQVGSIGAGALEYLGRPAGGRQSRLVPGFVPVMCYIQVGIFTLCLFSFVLSLFFV